VRILLTGVGCPGAHALISNLKEQDPEMFILGTNATEQAIGRWLCDDFAVVPWAYEENYVDYIVDLVEKIKLILSFLKLLGKCFIFQKPQKELKIIVNFWLQNMNWWQFVKINI